MVNMSSVNGSNFTAVPFKLKDWVIIGLSKKDSLAVGPRGQVSVSVLLNGHEFELILEPDGRGSHWMRVTDDMQARAGVRLGVPVAVTLRRTEVWPEPDVPDDLRQALREASNKVQDKWVDITPMARWEWIRWINATPSSATRAVRIEKTVSKLDGSHRRPCCFNLAACTEPYLSKNGKLQEV